MGVIFTLPNEPRLRTRVSVAQPLMAVCSPDHPAARLEALTLRSPGGEHRIDTRALFVMIGAAPNTAWLSGLAETDRKGFVLTGAAAGRESPYETSAPGIFAVGDVRAGSVKRVASAVGEGSVAISRVWDYVEQQRRDGGLDHAGVSGGESIAAG